MREGVAGFVWGGEGGDRDDEWREREREKKRVKECEEKGTQK